MFVPALLHGDECLQESMLNRRKWQLTPTAPVLFTKCGFFCLRRYIQLNNHSTRPHRSNTETRECSFHVVKHYPIAIQSPKMHFNARGKGGPQCTTQRQTGYVSKLLKVKSRQADKNRQTNLKGVRLRGRSLMGRKIQTGRWKGRNTTDNLAKSEWEQAGVYTAGLMGKVGTVFVTI